MGWGDCGENAMDLKISDIRAEGGTQPRARTDLNAVEEYTEAMLAGSVFPPVVVFYDGSDYWLADGFHRRNAAIGAGFETINAEVKSGTRRDAILYSVGANATHGQRRTNDDKRRSVLRLLEDDEWSGWSDREIARICAVGAPLVASIRSTLTVRNYSDETPTERTYTTKHGTTATMRTENIGRRETVAPPPVVNEMPLEDDIEPVIESTIDPVENKEVKIDVVFSSEKKTNKEDCGGSSSRKQGYVIALRVIDRIRRELVEASKQDKLVALSEIKQWIEGEINE